MAYRWREVTLLGLSLGLVSSMPVVTIGLGPTGASMGAPSQLLIPEDLQTGDLVFRTGRDMLARMVLTQGEAAQFSHVGLVDRAGPSVRVIHAIPAEEGHHGGVVAEPLDAFAAPAMALRVGFYRVAMTASQRSESLAYAKAQLGKPFDSQFAMSSEDAMYCTELVLKALRNAGVSLDDVPSVEIATLSEPAFPPDALRHSAKLKQISPGL